jgi:hypothetical protein
MIVHGGCCFAALDAAVTVAVAGDDIAGICTPVVGFATIAAALVGDS